MSEFLATLDVNNMEDHYIMEDEDDKQKKTKKQDKKEQPKNSTSPDVE